MYELQQNGCHSAADVGRESDDESIEGTQIDGTTNCPHVFPMHRIGRQSIGDIEDEDTKITNVPDDDIPADLDESREDDASEKLDNACVSDPG